MNIPELKEKIVKLAQDYSELGINAKSDEANDKRKARKGKGKAAAKALVAALAAGGLGAGYYVADRKGYIQQLKNWILEMSKNNGQGFKDIPGNTYNGLVDLTAQGVQDFKDKFMGGDQTPEVTDGVGRATVLGGLGSLGLGTTVHFMGPSKEEIRGWAEDFVNDRYADYIKGRHEVAKGQKAPLENVHELRKFLDSNRDVAEALELAMNQRNGVSYRLGRRDRQAVQSAYDAIMRGSREPRVNVLGGRNNDLNIELMAKDLFRHGAAHADESFIRPASGAAPNRPSGYRSKAGIKARINKVSPLASEAVRAGIQKRDGKFGLGDRMAMSRRGRLFGYGLSALPLLVGLGLDVAKGSSNYNEKKRQYAKQNESAKKK